MINIRRYLCMVIVLILVLVSFFRNEVWLEPQLLWSDVIKKSPSKQRGYLNLGIAYKELREYREATINFQKAIEINPFSNLALNAMYNLGSINLYEKNYDNAIQIFTEVLKSNSSYHKAYLGRAVAYIEKGLLDLAEANLKMVETLNPEDPNLYYNRARIYIEKGMLDEAIKAYTETIKLRPDFALAYNNRGVAYAEKGELKLAYADFKKALQLKPDLLEAFHNLQKIKN